MQFLMRCTEWCIKDLFWSIKTMMIIIIIIINRSFMCSFLVLSYCYISLFASSCKHVNTRQPWHFRKVCTPNITLFRVLFQVSQSGALSNYKPRCSSMAYLLSMNHWTILIKGSFTIQTFAQTVQSPHVRESGIQNPACKVLLLESGIQRTGIRIPLWYAIRNLSEYRKLESGIHRPGSGIQDLHGFSYMGRNS